MSLATGAKLQLEPGSWLEAAYEVGIGLIVGIAHFVKINGRWWHSNLIVPFLNVFGMQLRPESNQVRSRVGGADENTLKVVAVGYGRTGTYSLMLALEEMGFPTLHTMHLYDHYDIMSMWNDRVFEPSIKAGKSLMGKPDMQMILDAGFVATADLPVALYYEQIMEEFPDCKFILTTRQNSEVWFRSWDTLTKSITKPTFVGSSFFNSVHLYAQYLRWLFSVVNNDSSYLTAPLPLPDQNKEAAIASYEAHNRRVREVIPSDRLLEYNVGDGWEPLCKFLDLKECPQTPFPKTNSARSVQVQSRSCYIVPLLISLVVIFFFFSWGFRRATGMTVKEWSNCKSRELMRVLQRTLLGTDTTGVVWRNGKQEMAKQC